MRLKLLFPTLVAALAVGQPASAVIKHYTLSWTTIAEFNTTNPTLNKYPGGKGGPQSLDAGFIDDTNNGAPVLRKLLLLQENETTSYVPGLSGFIFLSMLSEQGPKKGLTFTGTGDTSTTIAWGLVTGWTITGGFWCHSFPSYICSYARGSDLATVEPQFQSPLYDLGTWTFHGTGFTSVPYINQVAGPASMSVGNAQYHIKGRLSAGLVPALPVLGVALLGASLLFAGARLSRKR
jgi:hypothetical protein